MNWKGEYAWMVISFISGLLLSFIFIYFKRIPNVNHVLVIFICCNRLIQVRRFDSRLALVTLTAHDRASGVSFGRCPLMTAFALQVEGLYEGE